MPKITKHFLVVAFPFTSAGEIDRNLFYSLTEAQDQMKYLASQNKHTTQVSLYELKESVMREFTTAECEIAEDLGPPIQAFMPQEEDPPRDARGDGARAGDRLAEVRINPGDFLNNGVLNEGELAVNNNLFIRNRRG